MKRSCVDLPSSIDVRLMGMREGNVYAQMGLFKVGRVAL